MTIIRRATLDDTDALAGLAECTFRDTFSAESSTTDMELHCTANFSANIQRIEILDPNYVTLLAEVESELVAFAQILLLSPKECVCGGRPSELHRLYVSSEWHGRGIAHEVMSEVLVAAAFGGADYIWLGVWEKNPKAIAFYRKYGFRVVGDHVFQVGTDPQRDLVMALAVDSLPVT